MITGTVVLDLARDSEPSDRRAMGCLYGIPSGVRVVLDVGSRTFVPPFTVAHLRQYVDSLHFDVHGSCAAVEQWVQALRASESARWGRSA